jgi:SpoVK/Ycf46/Vps4 family AAA+-type ATPase
VSRGSGAWLFDPQTDDGDLEHLFEKALKNRPAMVLFEDIDRAFPRTGESKARVSLQALLNCLDGVRTREGIIVVATSNEPTTLEHSILRWPGRFDRVVHFANPNAELRGRYFRHMVGTSEATIAERAVAESEGFSFAQLREAYILAGQHAFTMSSEITEDDLLDAIRILRLNVLAGANRSNAAGFKSPTTPEQG